MDSKTILTYTSVIPITTMDPNLLLTKLPLELRTLIWEFTLQVPPTNANDNHGIVWLTPDPRSRPSVLNLLLTCRQIKREAEDIFYRINRLAIDVSRPNEAGPGPARDAPHNTEASLARFLKSLPPGRLSGVHSLCIWLGQGYQHRYGSWMYGFRELRTVCKRLRQVPNLRTLHLMYDQPDKVLPGSSEDDTVLAMWRDRGVAIPHSHCFPPALRPDTGSELGLLKNVFARSYKETFETLQMLRQVEEVTLWGRDSSQEDDPWLAKAMQTYLPRYRAKHGLEWLYSSAIRDCRYMCSHGCESLDCEHLEG